MKARRDVSQHLKLWRWWRRWKQPERNTRSAPRFSCVRGVRSGSAAFMGRSQFAMGIGWRCRQEADFTVICLPGEAWVRLSALLVKAGAKLETDCGADANGLRSVRMGAEAEYRKPPSSRRDSKPGSTPSIHPSSGASRRVNPETKPKKP